MPWLTKLSKRSPGPRYVNSINCVHFNWSAAVVSWSSNYQISQEGTQEMTGKQKPNWLHFGGKDQTYLTKGTISAKLICARLVKSTLVRNKEQAPTLKKVVCWLASYLDNLQECLMSVRILLWNIINIKCSYAGAIMWLWVLVGHSTPICGSLCSSKV